jgi:F-box and leucine-rich repeat protein GRR1
VVELGRCCPELRWLAVAACAVGDDAVLALAGGCTRLVHLSINYPKRRVTPFAVQTLFTSLGAPGLKHFEACACQALNDDALEALGANHASLTHLDISACRAVSGAGVLALAAGCPELVDVYLGGCALVGDVALLALDVKVILTLYHPVYFISDSLYKIYRAVSEWL